ncbi:homeobox-leucine zipper protein HAT22-like [Andrographis paniculata]|uniref:homeobox-leucine zipper protein HAT22-like n=1 Tax=Andrographis paniculata TaxID=175694 RepID=UPI0021E8A5C1|nr:homeobox-leucine zipper protein HAT22-like [Andrographis paniculata]
MGFDDLCNTGLVLGLGFPTPSSSPAAGDLIKSRKPPAGAAQSKLDHLAGKFSEPSLTLSLSGETYAVKKAEPEEIKGFAGVGYSEHHSSADLYRQDSAASSFSNVSSVKREREMGSEEGEIERNINVVSSRISDEDDDGSNGRKKLRLSKAQSALLEESFKQHSTLNPKQKQELARELNLRPRQVEVWFQNRRARTKLKQTEVDCEFLKKCCETLTDENRRLHKELQELKALKLAQPLYMQLPAATLTMCPSCERIGAAVPENAAKSPYAAMAPKPHFYNPFTNQSAAC